jgi:hypothetical protein
MSTFFQGKFFGGKHFDNKYFRDVLFFDLTESGTETGVGDVVGLSTLIRAAQEEDDLIYGWRESPADQLSLWKRNKIIKESTSVHYNWRESDVDATNSWRKKPRCRSDTQGL